MEEKINKKLLNNSKPKQQLSKDNNVFSAIKNKSREKTTILSRGVLNPIWLSVSEASNVGGVNKKTIRRAIQSKTLKYKIINERYFIEITSLVSFLHSKTKLKNKLNEYGIGQYIDKWNK